MAENISEAAARHIAEVKASRERIAPVPADLKVNPQHLGELTHEQFLKSFSELQEFVINCYKDIEQDPIAWGYPNSYRQKSGNGGISIGPHENRLMNFLFAIVKSSIDEVDGDTLTIDYKNFSGRKNTKPDIMFKKFADKGLAVENFGKKSAHFTAQFPANPHVLKVLCAYFTDRPCRRCYGACSHMGSCYWYNAISPKTVFSYRFIEDPAEQRHETEFLAFVSGMPDELREIQYYLYSESKRYGYRFDPFKPVWSGGLLYEKRAVEWPRVGYIGDGWHGDDYRMFSFRAHVKFNKVFKTHPEKIAEFTKQRPDAFIDPDHMCNQHCGNTLNRSCHAHRVSYEIDGATYHNCGGIRIHKPTLDDVKMIVELYVLENGLKPI